MNLGIVGSQEFTDKILAFKIIDQIIEKIGEPEFIVSGRAKGADTVAEDYARARELNTMIFPARWKKYGKSAGHRRNPIIVKHSDEIIAFWDYLSPGTKGTIELAANAGKKVYVVNIKDGSIAEIN